MILSCGFFFFFFLLGSDFQDTPCRYSHGHRVLHSMNQMLNNQLSDLKRVNSNTANSHICDLKNLKFKKLPQLKKKANKDHHRFSPKLTNGLNGEKSLCLAHNLDKVKQWLEK